MPSFLRSLRMSLRAAFVSRLAWRSTSRTSPSASTRPPQIHLFAANTDAHLIEVPPSMRLRVSGPQPAGDCRAEGEHPAPDALVRDYDPSLGQEFLDIAEAQSKAEVHPHGTLDDVRREAV